MPTIPTSILWPDTTGDSAAAVGAAMHRLARALFPIPRSLTGDGVRRTLEILSESIPLTIHEVPSGTKVLDWVVPPEWNVREAWIRGPDGSNVVDFGESTLHLASYSEPFRGSLTLEELQPHLRSLPDRPTLTPYVRLHHDRSWAFCLPHERRSALPAGDYEVLIDATLEPGHLTYGECVLPGAVEDEVLVSAHCCHPALANDNLSGIVLATALARELGARPHRRLTYRFVFAPGTIGAVVWLWRNPDAIGRVRHGLVLTGAGDPGPPTYKRSRREGASIDRAMASVLRGRGHERRVLDFTPSGYDERQYNSPGYNLPIGCFMRTPWGEYPEYHTSADDLDFVTPKALADSFEIVRAALEVVEESPRYRATHPYGEPQLGPRGLWAVDDPPDRTEARLWVLNLSDGEHSLFDVADRSGLPLDLVKRAAAELLEAGLLKR